MVTSFTLLHFGLLKKKRIRVSIFPVYPTQAEAEAICKYAFVCPPTTVAPTATVPSASGHSAVPFRMKDIFADHTWLFTGSPEAGVCSALGASPVTVATFARELRRELLSSQVRDEVVLGHYLRRMLRGPILQELNRKIANISALEMKVRAGTMTFSDYEEALHRCTIRPAVGMEAVLIRQACSVLCMPGPGSAFPSHSIALNAWSAI